ncbi:SDR family NAD(P)-dependent oxidoreductase [Streptomyces sp. NPDC002143]
MDLGLNGRVVLVTGASGGIGREVATAFGAHGARVAVAYRSNQDAARETAQRVEKAGGTALVVRHELADKDSVHQAVTTVVQEWGHLDVLVNSATHVIDFSAVGTGVPFEEIPPQEWQTMLRVTVEGTVHAIQAALPHLRANQWGRIVNLSSLAVEQVSPGTETYSVAKAGVQQLGAALARDLGRDGILINTVVPGFTLTDAALNQIPEATRVGIAATTPSRRISTPQDVTSAILFLGSAANGNTTGQVLKVTGGL